MRYAPHVKAGVCRALLMTGPLSLSGALGGCSSDGSTDFRSLTSIARLAFAPPQRVSVKQASAIPYATIGVRLGGGPQAIGTLATDDGAQRLWAVGAKIMIATTRNGQIQRTVGLPYNLTWMIPSGAISAAAPGAKRRNGWSADFADLAVFSATIQCEEIPFGNVRISILGKPITTRRTNVQCVVPQLKWTFQNTYWTDSKTELVWKSIQYIHPKLDPIEIETLRPPS